MTENTFLNRYRENGHLRCLAYAEGYVMCRHKGAAPFLMPIDKWMKLSVKPLKEETPAPAETSPTLMKSLKVLMNGKGEAE